ncbi:MAG TPA: lipoate--protein ligase family protein [Opitutaceae bacterium]|nr:lipoate--protein ligase family protein [Opitutaceae bacterium]
MSLHLLPTRTAGAAENMAVDFLLLQRYPDPAPRFRHYGWRSPAFTFGYSQKWLEVNNLIHAPENMVGPGTLDICRRPTGGGIVDHREDWTYTLVIPRGHPLEAERASQSYRQVHECLAQALAEQAVPAQLQARPEEGAPGAPGPANLCFQKSEVFDVVNGVTEAKIAGAAQKRNQRGLLLQGSIWRPAAGAAVDWDRFGEAFAGRLAAVLGTAPERRPWPELNEEELSALIERYRSPEWQEAR